jgi:hypothetical protein
VWCIAEIISRFHLVAVQEERESAQGFLEMMQVLGGDWA